MKPKLAFILKSLGIYFFVSGITYALFSSFVFSSKSPLISQKPAPISPSKQVKQKVDPNLPKNEICPLNGVKYTTLEKEDWEKRRPLAIMIENSEDARPQSGWSKADIIYEAIAEGWITRFMAVFYCNTPFENIAVAPVRSARTYFVDWVSEYDALYNHVGGANRIGSNRDVTDPRADAIGQIDAYGIKDLDQFGIGYPDCYRNPDRLSRPVATEHTMICFTQNLYKIAEKRGWTNVDEKNIPWNKNFKEWKFKEDEKSQTPSTRPVKIIFTEGYEKYDVQWDYDAQSNTYKRTNGGVPHLDLDTNTQLSVKNVVVQIIKLTGPVDDLGHFLYTTIGSGKAIIFQDGQAIVGKWEKKSRIGRTQYFDATGKEITLNRGLTFIENVSQEKNITY